MALTQYFLKYFRNNCRGGVWWGKQFGSQIKHKLLFKTSYYKIKKQFGVFEPSRGVGNNDLHASDGRDTEALNCKPITNL